ncbi:hypothetical protein [Iodidimonas sp. SYSU 1G8]|uniref:hypothetical protein n=1 Tax=Iodidimonas sp. SYSU 1G8 TaxID=3133967 RepID=UPI0031FEA398
MNAAPGNVDTDKAAPARPRRSHRPPARIVLTLEPESLGGGAIDTAVRLARAYGAELAAVFVKTSGMLAMVSLPFGGTVISRSGLSLTIDRGGLDHRLDRLARQAQATLARAAGDRVRWSFRTATGYTEQVAALEALPGDLFAICSRTARQVCEAMETHACSLLLLGDGVARDRPVIALFEGDTALLVAARDMAEALGKELLVVLPSGPAAPRWRRSVRGWLDRRGLSARVLQSSLAEGAALAGELARLAPGLLVMGRQAPAGASVRGVYESAGRGVPLLLVS